jgi:hypothetical protein
MTTLTKKGFPILTALLRASLLPKRNFRHDEQRCTHAVLSPLGALPPVVPEGLARLVPLRLSNL